jgi:hypothetical protein
MIVAAKDAIAPQRENERRRGYEARPYEPFGRARRLEAINQRNFTEQFAL